MEYREVWAGKEKDLRAPRAVPVALPVKKKDQVRTCWGVAVRRAVPRTRGGVKRAVRTWIRGSSKRVTWRWTTLRERVHQVVTFQGAVPQVPSEGRTHVGE